jgi:hypothetical protein
METVEDKGLRFTIKIRVWGQGFDESISHGYCVDDTPFGISHPIGDIYIDVRTVTFKQLRPMIQYCRTGHMDKRSMMFQEALFIMSRLPNIYSRPKEELKRFQFGFINKKTKGLTVVSIEQEGIPIVNLVGAADMENHDIALVPLSQIDPDPRNPEELPVLSIL